MPTLRRLFGNRAERVAARFLVKKGYTILHRQFRNRFGEIDLIALDGDEVVFVEVKARRTNAFGYPEESVTAKKIERIVRVGQVFLQKHPHRSYRIDVISIEGKDLNKIMHFEGVDIA